MRAIWLRGLKSKLGHETAFKQYPLLLSFFQQQKAKIFNLYFNFCLLSQIQFACIVRESLSKLINNDYYCQSTFQQIYIFYIRHIKTNKGLLNQLSLSLPTIKLIKVPVFMLKTFLNYLIPSIIMVGQVADIYYYATLPHEITTSNLDASSTGIDVKDLMKITETFLVLKVCIFIPPILYIIELFSFAATSDSKSKKPWVLVPLTIISAILGWFGWLRAIYRQSSDKQFDGIFIRMSLVKLITVDFPQAFYTEGYIRMQEYGCNFWDWNGLEQGIICMNGIVMALTVLELRELLGMESSNDQSSRTKQQLSAEEIQRIFQSAQMSTSALSKMQATKDD